MHLSDCYRLLGLARNATLEDIKLAYRRLARKYHPDLNKDDPATAEKFRMVQEAYQILKDAAAGILPKPQDPGSAASRSPATSSAQSTQKPPSKPPPKSTTPKHPPKSPQQNSQQNNHNSAKVKIEVKEVRSNIDPIASDPELKLKLDTLRRLQDLLKERKYVVAIAIAEGLAQRFPKSPEVVHWQAVTYHRYSTELILAGKLREAEIYLNKAMETDPRNRELCFEVKRDLERVQQMR